MNLVLASNSATRRAMLAQCGIAHEVSPPRVDERALERSLGKCAPADIAMALAEAKACEVSKRRRNALVLGGDSVVTVAGRRFDKPASREDAAQHLTFFSGKCIELCSAAVFARENTVVERVLDKAELAVRDLSKTFIDHYLDAEWPEVGSSVGVFRLEARGPLLFKEVRGDFYTILGMPLLGVLQALRQQGMLTP